MKKQVMTVLALGIGAVALTNTSSSAQASGWGTGIQGEGLVLQVGHKHKHRRHGGIYFSFGGGHLDNHYYGENCRYYKRKARWTGRRYWWKKYRRCMYRNGY